MSVIIGRAIVSSLSCIHVAEATVALDVSRRVVSKIETGCMACPRAERYAGGWKKKEGMPFSELRAELERGGDDNGMNRCGALVRKSVVYAVDDCFRQENILRKEK